MRNLKDLPDVVITSKTGLNRVRPSKLRVIMEVFSTPCISFHKLSERQQTESWHCSLCHFSKPMIRLQFACPVSKQSCYWLRCWAQGQITPSEGSQLNTLPFESNSNSDTFFQCYENSLLSNTYPLKIYFK